MILSRDFLIAGIGTESNALAISSEANQNSLLPTFAAWIAELTMVRGSRVLCPGSPAKLNSDRIELVFRILESLLLIISMKNCLLKPSQMTLLLFAMS